MMKLHRPLCSDVTLRLVVDISPGFDEDDEIDELVAETNFTTHDVDNDNNLTSDAIAKRNLIYNKTLNLNNNSFRGDKASTANLDFNQNKNQFTRNNNRGHSHSCSWYSRQNTPDKTAKDIYNHEHVLSGEAYGDDFQRVRLDSEFKRFVEEEGNDYKEAPICQEFEDTWAEPTMNFSEMGKKGHHHHRHHHQYSDADLSCCLEDTPGLDNSKRQACDDSSDDADVGRSLYDTADGSIPLKRRSTEDDESDEKGSDDTGDDEFGDDSLENMDDAVMPEAPEELPIDCDEDVDVFENQMEQSMITSFYGEISASELAKSMIQSVHAEQLADEMTKSIAEEIHDVLLGDGHEKTDHDSQEKLLPFPYPFTLKHAGHLFDKPKFHFVSAGRSRSSSCTSRSTLDDACHETSRTSSSTCTAIKYERRVPVQPNVALADPKKNATVNMVSTQELEVTHRGLHRFIPRHKDEINIGIGDPLHVTKECDDLWCEGINLRTGEKGVFPAMYANDLNFLEESDDEEEYWKFSMKFLGSVEVTSHKGDETLVQAINTVATSKKDQLNSASLSTLEINQYGIRMIDKSKEGHEKDAFSHFFALKNISFCGTHPKNNRYFAFITKHPRDYKFACHVFYGDRPTHHARDALGEAFKRFYQEYMAFTHPTEDIYIE
ncbi:unnamed protein product [Lymnaea stagnalis]|uniref:JNK-interacting protein 1 n=1 Tax=Lymnaea stagnalis TaxID=6523 RepID=A0AAV2HJV6_LYMST